MLHKTFSEMKFCKQRIIDNYYDDKNVMYHSFMLFMYHSMTTIQGFFLLETWEMSLNSSLNSDKAQYCKTSYSLCPKGEDNDIYNWQSFLPIS